MENLLVAQKSSRSYENLKLSFHRNFYLSWFSFGLCLFKDVAKKKYFLGEIDSLQKKSVLYLETESRRLV